MSDAPKPVRSPSYPGIALRDAITAVSKIYSKYRTSEVDREIAAKTVGYSSLSGPAAKFLAGLAHYGLVGRAGKGELLVLPRAVSILYPDNNREYTEALRDAAFESDLFQEMRLRWPDFVPPEEAVENYLRKQGFNESAIRPATKAYLETLAFLAEKRAFISHGDASENDANTMGHSENEGPDMNSAATIDKPHEDKIASKSPPATELDLWFNLTIDGSKIEIFTDKGMDKEKLEKLIKMLELYKSL